MDDCGKVSRNQLQGLPVVQYGVAGIDLGSERHWVCAPTPDGTAREVADFGATTTELIRMAEWLLERGANGLAAQGAGVATRGGAAGGGVTEVAVVAGVVAVGLLAEPAAGCRLSARACSSSRRRRLSSRERTWAIMARARFISWRLQLGAVAMV